VWESTVPDSWKYLLASIYYGYNPDVLAVILTTSGRKNPANASVAIAASRFLPQKHEQALSHDWHRLKSKTEEGRNRRAKRLHKYCMDSSLRSE
jgi:hypothetical protein